MSNFYEKNQESSEFPNFFTGDVPISEQGKNRTHRPIHPSISKGQSLLPLPLLAIGIDLLGRRLYGRSCRSTPLLEVPKLHELGRGKRMATRPGKR